MPEYIEALKKEIKYTADIISHNGTPVETVYIGGGTPTTLTPRLLEEMIDCLYDNCDLSKMKEFTVEAGRPDTITEEKLKVLKKYNVDRISINPQSMNDSTLKIIGRAHSADDIREAMKMARHCGFDNINMDVIAGLPGEDMEMFKYTLSEVEKLEPEDTTVHTMSIKRSSRLNEYLDEYDWQKASWLRKWCHMPESIWRREESFRIICTDRKISLETWKTSGIQNPGSSLSIIFILWRRYRL